MGNVIAETNLSNSPTAYYIYGAGGLEARILPDGTAEYYVSDYRGSVVAMVDASANITHKYQYDEFGKVIQKDESDANPFRYVGKYGVMYANDNLYYMRARFYDPTIGRFLSEDPIWSTNLYPYADNNPVMGIDPKGEANVGAGSVAAIPNRQLFGLNGSNYSWEGYDVTGVNTSEYNPYIYYCGEGAVSNPQERTFIQQIAVSQIANQSCFIHDKQYEIAGRLKGSSDIAFKENVFVELRNMGYSEEFARSVALYYFDGVDLFAANAYQSAQKEAKSKNPQWKLNPQFPNTTLSTVK
jgi:RHS repeat-associated protein